MGYCRLQRSDRTLVPMSKAKEAASIPVFEGGPKLGDVLRAVLLSKPKKRSAKKRTAKPKK